MGEEREKEGVGGEPALFSLANQHPLSQGYAQEVQSAWEGELTPSSLGGQDSTSSLWTTARTQYRWAAQIPRYSACLCLNYLLIRRLLRGIFFSPTISPSSYQGRNQHCSHPSATGTLLAKQLNTEITLLSFYISPLFSEDHSLPSF